MYGRGIGPEDVDRDCKVDVVDLAIVALHYGQKVGDPNWYAPADVNGDGVVNVIDLAMVGIKYGTTFIMREDVNHDCVVNILDLAIVAINYGFGM
jgi:hypothetical protein